MTPAAVTGHSVPGMSDQTIHPAEVIEPGALVEQSPPDVETIEQPAKVMRIGSMIKQLLDEVRAAPLDEPSRERLRDIYETLGERARCGAVSRPA